MDALTTLTLYVLSAVNSYEGLRCGHAQLNASTSDRYEDRQETEDDRSKRSDRGTKHILSITSHSEGTKGNQGLLG
ncbi:hypothetical protein E2C01_009849 [Portunus trituberculatus]|uniref:Uncharacterized protein n=1 Tax=Portunus trituberculatus TaxID=210409 RepID=A0A5B7D746_PORTR|nr:hypothetical protein [Portunus trituberculatus]